MSTTNKSACTGLNLTIWCFYHSNTSEDAERRNFIWKTKSLSILSRNTTQLIKIAFWLTPEAEEIYSNFTTTFLFSKKSNLEIRMWHWSAAHEWWFTCANHKLFTLTCRARSHIPTQNSSIRNASNSHVDSTHFFSFYRSVFVCTLSVLVVWEFCCDISDNL